MGLGGCYSCVKYLMFAFNFLFWLLGCAVLGVGIWVRVDPNFKQYVDSSETFNHLYTGAYVFIITGLIVMIIGFLGCCGAIRESQCMLATFFICLFVIFAALVGIGIWAVIAKDSLKATVTDTLKDGVRDYDTDAKAKSLMDNFQTNFECCGSTTGSADYMFAGRAQPPSTCALENWGTPCDTKLFNYFAENLAIIAGVAIGIGVVMVLGMIFSMLLCCAIKEAGTS